MTSGLQPSDLILVAARPSMGKTSFVLNIAQHIGTQTEMTVGFFSLEMSKEQLFMRMLTSEARIDAHRRSTAMRLLCGCSSRRLVSDAPACSRCAHTLPVGPTASASSWEV